MQPVIAVSLDRFDAKIRKKMLSKGKLINGNIVLDVYNYHTISSQYIPPKINCDKYIKKRGLGDWVESLLHPFVVRLDKWFGTELVGCTACARRKANLNRWWHRGVNYIQTKLNKLGN